MKTVIRLFSRISAKCDKLYDKAIAKLTADIDVNECIKFCKKSDVTSQGRNNM